MIRLISLSLSPSLLLTPSLCTSLVGKTHEVISIMYLPLLPLLKNTYIYIIYLHKQTHRDCGDMPPSTKKRENEEDGRLIDEAWHWISTLPMEQSLVLGGGGSLAFFELARHARTFLANNMKSFLRLIFPNSAGPITKTTDVQTVACQNVSPLIARNGLVEAMLLTQTGIFYLKTEDLTLYQAQGYCQNADVQPNVYVRTAISKLSPHALSLYHKAQEQSTTREDIHRGLQTKYHELLDDCLLHMILNDLSSISSSGHPSLITIKPIALDLIQKITLTVNSGSGWTRAWTWFGYAPPTDTTPTTKTSIQCLTEWTTNHAPDIQRHLKQIFTENSSRDGTKPNLFFRDSGEWQRNALEVNRRGSNEQWSKSLEVTGCAWNRIIGPIRIELELTPPDSDDNDWISIARLRYTII